LAFIRWRGNSAALLTTVYDQGRSRQVRLANLGGAYVVHAEVRAEVAERFPDIPVDWEAVERELTEGPPSEQAATAAGVPNERLAWLDLERGLRYWAGMIEHRHREHAGALRAAAAVLAQWREGKPDFPYAQPMPGWDREMSDRPADADPGRGT
jgi:hypothetical protein